VCASAATVCYQRQAGKGHQRGGYGLWRQQATIMCVSAATVLSAPGLPLPQLSLPPPLNPCLRPRPAQHHQRQRHCQTPPKSNSSITNGESLVGTLGSGVGSSVLVLELLLLLLLRVMSSHLYPSAWLLVALCLTGALISAWFPRTKRSLWQARGAAWVLPLLELAAGAAPSWP
jgi:hypothetical protein